MKAGLLEFLSGFITEERYTRFRHVLEQRTRYLTVVVENAYQSHNISAVLRSCECFGIQDVHIIENLNEYRTHKDIALGADKWLSISRYRQGNAVESCLRKLRRDGYRIVATSPRPDACTIWDLPLDQKTAVVLGTELDGISEEVKQAADLFFTIPMAGLTESLNLSVSAGICLFQLSKRVRESKAEWKLDEDEKTVILTEWIKLSLNQPETVIREFLRKNGVK
ncbi:MAG TPA: RNA methyltransferase [Bacteroidales bacterium]|nr:RNA methyltransferase [Bacteroidales bacterium]HSA44062.1 RNA methyltransferase [Bacteroidales bacterium]